MDLNNKWYGGIIEKTMPFMEFQHRSCAVLRIDCNTDTAKRLDPITVAHSSTGNRGVQVNGKIYAHPSHADTVLVIDTNL
jgi:hypothetical protein